MCALRVTNSMMVQNFMRDYQNIVRTMSKQMSQIASGRKIEVPSDDPVRMAQYIRLTTNVWENNQYSRNTEDAKSWMANTEIAVTEAETILQGVRTLIVQANNAGTLTQEERAMIGKEIEMRLGQLMQLGNSSYDGRYIFNGQMTTEIPYRVGVDNYVEFVGDTGPGILQYEISPGVTVQVNIPPQSIFRNDIVNILDEMRNLADDLQIVKPQDYGVIAGFGTNQLAGKTVLANDLVMQVQIGNDPAVNVTIPQGKYATPKDLVEQINTALSYQKLSTQLVASLNANNQVILKTTSSLDANDLVITDGSAGPDTLDTVFGLSFVHNQLAGDRVLSDNITLSNAVDFRLTLAGSGTTADLSIPVGNYPTVNDLVTAINTQISGSALIGLVTAAADANGQLLFTAADPNEILRIEDLTPGGSTDNLGNLLGLPPTVLTPLTNNNSILALGDIRFDQPVTLADDLNFSIQVGDLTREMTLPAGTYSGADLVGTLNGMLVDPNGSGDVLTDVSFTMTPTGYLVFTGDPLIDPATIFMKDDPDTPGALLANLGIPEGTHLGYVARIDILPYVVGRGSQDISSVVLSTEPGKQLKFEIREGSNVATIVIPPESFSPPPSSIVYSGVEIVAEINRQLTNAGLDHLLEAGLSTTNRLVFMCAADVDPSRFKVRDLSEGTDNLQNVIGMYEGDMMTYLKKADEGIALMLRWLADLGARTNRMELTLSRLEDTTYYITALVTNQSYVDIAELTIELKQSEARQRAALGVGARIMPPTLLDFLR